MQQGETDFKNLVENKLEKTYNLLKQGEFAIHPSVTKLTLEGSRGLQNNPRPDSDLDLSLFLDPKIKPTEALCEEIVAYTLDHWKSDIELDLAVVFDKEGCGLKCFDVTKYQPDHCPHGIDCVGIYKNQKGFKGFVPDIGLEVKLMYPVLVIWEKPSQDK